MIVIVFVLAYLPRLQKKSPPKIKNKTRSVIQKYNKKHRGGSVRASILTKVRIIATRLTKLQCHV